MRTVAHLDNPPEGSPCVRRDLAVHERPPLEVYGTRGAWIERASPLTERFGARHATSREAASPTSVIAATMTSQAHEIEAVAAEQRPQRPALIAVTNALDRGGMSANLAPAEPPGKRAGGFVIAM